MKYIVAYYESCVHLRVCGDFIILESLKLKVWLCLWSSWSPRNDIEMNIRETLIRLVN